MAKIEFYVGSAEKYEAVLDDGAVPREGEFVNIRGVTWRVRRVTWAVDNADDVLRAKLRANVELEKPRYYGANARTCRGLRSIVDPQP